MTRPRQRIYIMQFFVFLGSAFLFLIFLCVLDLVVTFFCSLLDF